MTDSGDETAFHSDVMQQIRDNGRVDGWLTQFDMLILHTIGAKTGQPRQNPMAYQKAGDGDEIFVFASNNGKETNSAWYHSALAHPDQGGTAFELR